MNPGSSKISAQRLVDELAASGRYHFTTSQAEARLRVSLPAVHAALRRLEKRGVIAAPSRGFFVVIPPEYRKLGCLPAEQFVPQLMETLGLTYYVGLLSAAQYHGAAHHRPQEFQVMVAKHRRPIECGEVRVGFVARKAVNQVPTATLNTPRGVLRISSPEATALDLIGYPEHVGGIENAATVIAELIEKLDGEKLLEAAKTAKLPWNPAARLSP